MSGNIKDLIKQEKERRRLLKEEKKKQKELEEEKKKQKELEEEKKKQKELEEEKKKQKELEEEKKKQKELEEEEKKKKSDINISVEENIKNKPCENNFKYTPKNEIYLNIKNNYEEEIEDNIYDKTKEIYNDTKNIGIINVDTINTLNYKPKKNVHFNEPTAPLNKLKRNNLKNAFLEYIHDKSNTNVDTHIVTNNKKELQDDSNNNLPADFFDIPTTLNSNNSNSDNDNKSDGSNSFDENDKQIKIFEKYEFVEDKSSNNIDLAETKDLHKKLKKKRKRLEKSDNSIIKYDESDSKEEREGYYSDSNDILDNSDNNNNNHMINRCKDNKNEKENNIMNLLNNDLYDITHYKQSDTAYYEELDYLHKMLIEKKKYILGNLYDEKKEQNDEQEQNILIELNEFNKNKNLIKDNNQTKQEKNKKFNIDEIYKLLNLKKKKYLEDYELSRSLTDNNKNEEDSNDSSDSDNNNAYIKKKKKTHKQKKNIPEGFFDDKEQDILIRENISLAKINEKIEEIRKEKNKILTDNKNTENIFEEKKNYYIDYLYDDKFDNKENVLNEIKTKMSGLHNVLKIKNDKDGALNQVDNFHKMSKKKKKKKNIDKKKSNIQFDQIEEESMFDWRKKKIAF
ncbi:conserved protein, unknown function [Hepatocystis sp. ex Piliocolobus tephrosceles]|nr:conserved protein, unknown function [Hepatocystis sp. ex Piliocolobus tephrosceles]